MSDGDIYFRITILFVLLILSGFFSGSETALTSMSAARIGKLKEEDEESANALKRIKKKLNDILVTILIGNNIVNIAATAILTEVIVQKFGSGTATLVATGIMTTLILIFGEITPKTYASQHPEKVAIVTGKWLEILSLLFKPLLIILNGITTVIIRLFGGQIKNEQPFVTEEDIRSLVDVGEEEGVVKHQEREMIEGIFEMDDIDVTEVMIPRMDIVAIDHESTILEALEIIIENGHSRLPVYKETIDNIIGVVYAKDLLPFVSIGKAEIEAKNIDELIRAAYYIPETKKVNQLLKELQQEKVHMAIVLDEYGGTEGLVTIEDILEEIVGDIFDEYDDEVDMIKKVDDKTYIVVGETEIEEINEYFEIDIPEDDFDSIGGYVFSTLDRVPVQGDIVEYKGLKMTVKKVANRRIMHMEVKDGREYYEEPNDEE